MALSWLAIGAVIAFLVIVVSLAVWASISEAQERKRINRFFREWDAETARLRQVSQRMRDRRSGGDVA